MSNKILDESNRPTKQGISYSLEPADEGGYLITVVDYPTCVTQGETLDEALSNAEDALLGCLIVDQESGFPISETLQSWMAWAQLTDEQEFLLALALCDMDEADEVTYTLDDLKEKF